MSAISGKGGKVAWDTAGVVSEVLGWQIDMTGDQVDDTVMSNGASSVPRTFIGTVTSWTASLTLHYDPADSDSQEAMTPNASATLKLYPEGDGSGKKYWSGTALVKTIAAAAQVDGKITRNITLQGTGALTRATV